MDLGLRQKDVAARLGANVNTVTNWELDQTAPALTFMPTIISFLGYSPFRPPRRLPERLRAFRQASGLSQKALAAILRVDPSTVWHWECGKSQPNERRSAAINNILNRPATP